MVPHDVCNTLLQIVISSTCSVRGVVDCGSVRGEGD